MALQFPINPNINQLYQSGSSATYSWNGSFWQISAPGLTNIIVATASYSERVANVQSAPPTTGTGSMWYDIDTGNTYIKYGTAWVPVQSNTVNATSASFATTASALIGSQATYVQAYNQSQQSFPNVAATTLTNWTNIIAVNASGWNPTTGVFTAPRSGIYLVSARLMFQSFAPNAIGNEYNLSVVASGLGAVSTSYSFAESTANILRAIPPVIAIVTVAAGQTIFVHCYQATGAPRLLFNNAFSTTITIQELPSKIQR